MSGCVIDSGKDLRSDVYEVRRVCDWSNQWLVIINIFRYVPYLLDK